MISIRLIRGFGVLVAASLAAAVGGYPPTSGATPEIVVYLKPNEATTLLQGGTGDWRFESGQQPAQATGPGGTRLEFFIDPAAPEVMHVRQVRVGLPQQTLTREIGVFTLFDDGLSIYAEWVPLIRRVDGNAIGPVRVVDLKANRRVTLQIDTGPPPESVVFVLDASGSMKGEKIELAKRALIDALGELEEGTEFAVWAFFDCDDIKLLHRFGTSHRVAQQSLSGITAQSATPLGDAMAKAFDYLHQQARHPPERRRLVLLSDGLATCGRDPLDVVNGWDSRLKGSQQLVVVGFDVASAESKQLADIAKAAGGSYLETDKQDVSRTLKYAVRKNRPPSQ